MLIADALRHAETAQEVCYLMTSYVETLVVYDTARHLPARITVLPVRGLVDCAARLACLLDVQRAERAHPPGSNDSAILDEAIQLFREAMLRLNALDVEDVATYSFERRAAVRPGLEFDR